jgi:hypothetical protein
MTAKNNENIENHISLAVVSLCLSFLGGFLPMPAAVASLIFALRTEDKKLLKDFDSAKQSSKIAKICGWLSIGLLVIPWILIICFWVFFGAIAAWLISAAA